MIAKRPSSTLDPSRGNPPTGATRWAVSLIAIAVAALLVPTQALAADDDKKREWYFEFQGGITHVPNQTIHDGSGNMGRVEPHTDAKKIGFNVGGALGRSFMDFLRGEVAVSYRENGLDEVSFGATPSQNTDGEIGLITAMLNGYVEGTPELIGIDLGVVPFVGIGIGYGQLTVDSRLKTAEALDIKGAEHVFAYNAMAGFRVKLSKITSVSAMYRYVGTTDAEETRATIGGVDQDLSAEYDAHEAVLGLRFEF